MANLGEIRVESREGEGEKPTRLAGDEQSARARRNKRRGSRKRRNSCDSVASVQSSRLSQDDAPGEKLENGGREQGTQPVDGREKDLLSSQEGHRAEFYDMYRREAEEYDKDYIKKYDEDLNTTLIFAGLFSAITSAFITQIDPQLQPDPNQETTALLRVLIQKIDSAAFGGDVPTVPVWTGPPRTIVLVEAILYASLAASLFSAFLATLGKQWLNRYTSNDVRGSAIERSQNRQRKLDGIAAWYFDHVMESLPLVLQLALLLLGSGLSLYLWGVNTTIASVIIAATSFGVAFYAFIIIAGTVSTSCPYQTPGPRVLRYILQNIIPIIVNVLRSTFRFLIDISASVWVLVEWWYKLKGLKSSIGDITILLLATLLLPFWLVWDACILTLAMAISLITPVVVVWDWLHRTRGLDKPVAVLDLKCISWVLQTSLDKAVHLSTLKLLAEMTALADFNPDFVSACFDILAGCVAVVNGKAVITQESEELAKVSAQCCLRSLSRLATMDPKLSALRGVRQRYTRTFPFETNFEGLPSDHSLRTIHNIFYSASNSKIRWKDYKLPSGDQVTLAHNLAQLAHRRASGATWSTWNVFLRATGHKKVPRWILRFALHHLSQNPPPPTSIITNCLMIIAIDLGCAVSITTTLDESGRLNEISSLITEKLAAMAAAADPAYIYSKRKAVTAFFPYAVSRGRDGEHAIIDKFLDVADASDPAKRFMWGAIRPFIPTLFNEASPQTIVLVSPHVPWDGGLHDKNVVTKWAEAVSAVSAASYTEEVKQSVVETLLCIASADSLRQYIPVDSWSWLKKRPSLPPVCLGRLKGTRVEVFREVRKLGDVETLKSYLLLVWSEWDYADIWFGGDAEMQTSIREDFSGTEMKHHREELIRRLDHILRELDRGLGHLKQYKPALGEQGVQRAKKQYGELRRMLAGMELELE